MNIEFLKLLAAALALPISLLSVWIATRAFAEARRANLSTHHQKYAAILRQERAKVRKDLAELRRTADEVGNAILHLLNPYSKHRTGKFLRHVVGEVCRDRADKYLRLLKQGDTYEMGRFPANLIEIDMDEPELPAVVRLQADVPEAEQKRLYSDIRSLLKEYWKLHESLKPRLMEVCDELDHALSDSQLEHYALSASPQIERRIQSTAQVYRKLIDFDLGELEIEPGHIEPGFAISAVFYSVAVLYLVANAREWDEANPNPSCWTRWKSRFISW